MTTTMAQPTTQEMTETAALAVFRKHADKLLIQNKTEEGRPMIRIGGINNKGDQAEAINAIRTLIRNASNDQTIQPAFEVFGQNMLVCTPTDSSVVRRLCTMLDEAAIDYSEPHR